MVSLSEINDYIINHLIECIFFLYLITACFSWSRCSLSSMNNNKCVFLCSFLQEGAECLVSSQLLEPSLGSGEERESRPCHSQRSLPQQHHPTLCPDQRGLRTPLQKGDFFFFTDQSISLLKPLYWSLSLMLHFFISFSVQSIISLLTDFFSRDHFWRGALSGIRGA